MAPYEETEETRSSLGFSLFFSSLSYYDSASK